MYQRGEGVTRDARQAVGWYRQAAAQGDAQAQVNLGFIYNHGLEGTRDAQQAVGWYRQAAEQGNAQAQ